jgi:D-proline reductase (dithiol) PrdB
VSLVSRHLEENGIPTIIIGSARDIVEHCGVARFLFTDFPLGNPCGPPFQPEMQAGIIEQAIGLLETAVVARTTVTAAVNWPDDPDWRDRYNRVQPEDSARLLAEGNARRKLRAMLKQTHR